MDGPLRLNFLAVIGSGALGLAVLAYTGAVWPYAPNEEALAPLAFANAITFVCFLLALLFLASGSIVASASGAAWHMTITNTLAGLNFIVGLVLAALQITEAMNAWFDVTPRMPDGLIMATRTGLLVAFVWLLISLGLWVWWRLKRQRS